MDGMDIAPSSESLDLQTMRTRIRELEEIYNQSEDMCASDVLPSDSDQLLLQDSAVQLQSKVEQIISECSGSSFLGVEDLDGFLEHLNEELNMAEAESAKISNEIEVLARTQIEDSGRLESDLEEMKASLDLISSQDFAKGNEDASLYGASYGGELGNLEQEIGGQAFEIFRLEDEIEKSKVIFDSLKDLDSVFKRLDAIEQIEDALSGLKVVDFDGTFVRLSFQTFVPKLEELLCQLMVDTSIPSEINHELLIELDSGTMEPKSAEIFPNDVYIGDIFDAAKSFRHLLSQMAPIETRSSLEWFVRKVQERIIQSTLRRYVVNNSNTTRHSFEYMDRDELILAHLVGGVDVFIKFCQDWPMTSSPLKLASLKCADHHSKEISLSLLSKVEEAANSLDVQIQQNLCSFVDAIEKILIEQACLEVH